MTTATLPTTATYTWTVEFTAYDLGAEVGTFDVELGGAPEKGDVIDGMRITNIRRWDAESLELEADIEYV